MKGVLVGLGYGGGGICALAGFCHVGVVLTWGVPSLDCGTCVVRDGRRSRLLLVSGAIAGAVGGRGG